MTPSRRLVASLAPCLFVLGAGAPAARALDGLEVVTRADEQNRAATEALDSTMVIVSADGLKRERRFRTLRKAGEGHDDKVLIRFLFPEDVAGSGLLTLEQEDGDEQWLFLRDLGKSKRLAGGSKAGRFMGSDLSHADMRTENLAGHAYDLLGEETVEGRRCHKVEAVPKTDAVREETGYGARLLFIDVERAVPVKIEFFDLEGRPLKVLVASGWQRFGEVWRSGRVVIEHLQKGTRTVIEHDQAGRRLGEPLDDAVFTKRTLEKP